jgi:hypothetical protein
MKLFLKDILLKLLKFLAWHRDAVIGFFFIGVAVADMYLMAYLAHIWSRPEPWYAAPTYVVGIFTLIASLITAIVYFHDNEY